MSLDRYILRQCLTPFIVSLAVLTAVVWLTQALQRADMMVEHGQGIGAFLRLSLLIVPSLLSILIPIAVFVSALFALQRLHGDSEIAVLFAAGVGRMRIAAPFLLVAAAAAAVMLWLNIDATPRSHRALRSEVIALRSDLARFVIRSAEFASAPGGFTVYAEEALPEGRFVGLLVSDYRDPSRRTVYLAQRAVLQDTASGMVLQLLNGSVQRDTPEGRVELVAFDRTSVNLDRLAALRPAPSVREPSERYVGELLRPDMNQEWDKKNARELIAEGHNRLASPLYTIAFALIALAALLTDGGAKGRYAPRIAIACLAAGLLQITAILLVNLSASAGIYWPLYATPLIASGVIAAAFMLSKPAPTQRAAV